MLHIVDFQNHHLYHAQLDEMFRLRHTVFVERRKWVELNSKDGRETDEFDDDRAVYLLGLDSKGRLACGARLNPTRGPNLLRDKFKSYVDGPIPHSDNIWDLSKWVVDDKYRLENNPSDSRPGRLIHCGLMEFAVNRGLTHFTTVTETRLLKRLDVSGWTFKAIGPPTKYEQGEAQAIIIDASVETLIRARSQAQIHEDVIVHVQPHENPFPAPPKPNSPWEVRLTALLSELSREQISQLLDKLNLYFNETFELSIPEIVERLTHLDEFLEDSLEEVLHEVQKNVRRSKSAH